MLENINWYPGHMKKTGELIRENLKLVDTVVEVIDARIPVSSRNPAFDDLLRNKKRVVALNKSDLSESAENEKWAAAIGKSCRGVALTNCVSGEGVLELVRSLDASRLMIVGVPNVGKSSLINRLAGRKSAKTGDRPGVTRGKQWLNLERGIMLLDTPGILWPKFEDPKTGVNLAMCGAIKDEILDRESLALELIGLLSEKYPGHLMNRYKLIELADSPVENLTAIARARGFLLPGNRVDYDRAARTLLDEFRSGMIGRVTLEPYDEIRE